MPRTTDTVASQEKEGPSCKKDGPFSAPIKE
jgi:hypothetical protein